jgi:SPP1 gp7 family putative phage head morphogenesis protein
MTILTIEELKEALKLPINKAIEFFKKKGVKLSDNYKKTAELIRKQSWSVSGVTKMRILQDTKKSLETAIKDGQSFNTWVKALDSFFERNGWTPPKGGNTRGKVGTIFQTNIQSSYNDGRFVNQMETADTLPYYQFLATIDDSTTEGCLALHGKVFRKDDPMFAENYRPPRHYNCRSRLRTVPNSVAKSLGVHTTDDFKEAKSSEQFQGKKGAFDYEPKKKDFNPNLFNDYEKEMKQAGF